MDRLKPGNGQWNCFNLNHSSLSLIFFASLPETTLRKAILREIILIWLIALLFPTTALTQIKHIWALGDNEKVFRDDLSHPYKNGNLTWDGKTIRLKGLYNEVMAFQVILETGNNAVNNVDLSVEYPVNKSGAIIGGNTLKYGPSG